MRDTQNDPLVVVIVGAGPRGTGVLERLLANAAETPPSRPLSIELVDPHPPGAGRVWRERQSPLMWMNATAENVTMFPDETVTFEGPIRPGPSLSEWAAADGACADVGCTTFATRQVQSRYLRWVFDKIVAERPPNVSVRVHTTRATQIEGGTRTRQRVWLEGRDEPLRADAVILAMGHLDAVPGKDHRLLADFADRHDLRYLPCEYSADTDLSRFRPGEDVIMRGMGAAFIDLMVLLTEGRGGRYLERDDGRLRYVPSGQEPRLHVGSRRGVPYRSKISYRLAGDPTPLPRFFTASDVDERFADRERIEFWPDLWPLMAKEIAYGYYHELFTAHPDRVAIPWERFDAAYAGLDWGGEPMRELIEASVPAEEDRLDLAALDKPLRGLDFDDPEQLQEKVRDHVRADIDRRSDSRYSADLGAFLALLSVYGQMPLLRSVAKLPARSRVADLNGWWQGFFEYYGSGSPGERTRQLLALAEAGVIRFVGADMWVGIDEEKGVYRAGGTSTPHVVEATAMIEARLPDANLHTCTEPLLRSLYRRGDASEHVLVDEDGFVHRTGLLNVSPEDFRVVSRNGTPHPRRFALGPFTNVRQFATFARPRSNAVSFRQNDRLARDVLSLLDAQRSVPRLVPDYERAPARGYAAGEREYAAGERAA
ncbi:FAD/NAD(P)-binding protein [Sphaerisporangium sp. TRM90804]|uniref:FAD/NAD(P)-binding protein n=1 Tax=Sphaerisporangium sp. TRM90804 TaxID=3031113 RepID=UPI00244D41D6|nr:FAD/NAD(P)-binding protein [Sphaerisporangium sp. TRM90804]MDH2426532.1 FAD/NAD(P)-binding protein [Sphaerisporangium sp. TRM90804]